MRITYDGSIFVSTSLAVLPGYALIFAILVAESFASPLSAIRCFSLFVSSLLMGLENFRDAVDLLSIFGRLV